METFSFPTPINLVEEGKWLLAVTSFDATNFVFNITGENNSFPISIAGCWKTPNCLENGVIYKLKKLLKLRSQNDIGLHVEEVRKRGNQIKIGDKEYELSDFDTSKKDLVEEIKSAKYYELEDLVYRMGLTYDESMDVSDKK